MSESELVDGNKKFGLKKTVGLWTGFSMIIGGGIFVAPKAVLSLSGSIGAALCVWLVCGIVSLFGALCFAEIGILVPESGGEMSYILRGFSKLNKNLARLISFLVSWTQCIVYFPLVFTFFSLTSSSYILSPFLNTCGFSFFIKKLGALLIMVIATLINLYDVEFANKTIVILSSTKITALIVIVIGGLVNISSGHTENFKNLFQGKSSSVFKLISSFYSGVFSYSGWNNLNYITEEIENPEKNLPLAIAISICSVTVIYILTNISYFSVLTKEEFLSSSAVGVAWADHMLGKNFSWFIPLAVSLSTFCAAICVLYSASRFKLASLTLTSRNQFQLKIFTMLNCKRKTPDPSILFTFILALIYLIAFSDIDYLIGLISFVSWLFNGLTFASLIIIRLKLKEKNQKSLIRIPLVIPIILCLISLYFVITPFVSHPQLGHLAIFGIFLFGIVVFILFVHFKFKIKYLSK